MHTHHVLVEPLLQCLKDKKIGCECWWSPKITYLHFHVLTNQFHHIYIVLEPNCYSANLCMKKAFNKLILTQIYIFWLPLKDYGKIKTTYTKFHILAFFKKICLSIKTLLPRNSLISSFLPLILYNQHWTLKFSYISGIPLEHSPWLLASHTRADLLFKTMFDLCPSRNRILKHL